MENSQITTNNEVSVDGGIVKKLNFFQRFIGIIVSPGETMKNLAEKPRVLFPILATALGMLLYYIVRFPLYQEFVKHTTEAALLQQSSTQQMSLEQIDGIVKFSTVFGLATTPVWSVVQLLIVSAIILGIAKIFKGEGRFKQYMSVIGYSYVITLLYLVLSGVVSFFSNQLMLNTSLTNITNVFAPDLQGTFLYGIIRGIDLFTVWYYVVIAIGVTSVSKLSKAKVYTIVGIIFLVAVLLGANGLKSM